MYNAHTGKMPEYFTNSISFDKENPLTMLSTSDTRRNGDVAQFGHYNLIIPTQLWNDHRKHCRSRFHAHKC